MEKNMEEAAEEVTDNNTETDQNTEADQEGKDAAAESVTEEKEETAKKQDELKDVLDFVNETLGDKVSAVRLSRKLLTAPVCMTTDGTVTLEMERYFKRMPDLGLDAPKAERVLELNSEHPSFKALQDAIENDVERAKKLAQIYHSQALLIAGEPLEDPSTFAETVCSLF